VILLEKLETYKSGEIHDSSRAKEYSKTHEAMHRFLAYRDFPLLVKDFENINKVLDLGSGAGDSSQYLFKKGYEVLGTDKSSSMIKQSRLNFPYINFVDFDNIKNIYNFDLVFSCFVLFELSSKNEIVDYLNLSSDKLRNGGLFFGITGSQDLHQKVRNWACFDVNYPVNENPRSGELVKLGLKDPKMEFYDYFWTELDYRECFQLSNLELFRVYYPLGYRNEKFEWRDELFISPFVIFMAKKIKRQ